MARLGFSAEGPFLALVHRSVDRFPAGGGVRQAVEDWGLCTFVDNLSSKGVCWGISTRARYIRFT